MCVDYYLFGLLIEFSAIRERVPESWLDVQNDIQICKI